MTNDLIDPGIAPTTPEQRTWRWHHYLALWLGMVIYAGLMRARNKAV